MSCVGIAEWYLNYPPVSYLQVDRATHKPSLEVAIFGSIAKKRFHSPLKSAPGQQVQAWIFFFFNFEKSIFLFLQIASIARSPVSGCALRT